MIENPKEVTYLEWHYMDLEKFVEHSWGVKWEGSAAMDFPPQDSYRIVEVDFGVDSEDELNLWIDNYTFEEAKSSIDEFKQNGMKRESGAGPDLNLLLNWLAWEGRIPSGKYLITVWW